MDSDLSDDELEDLKQKLLKKYQVLDAARGLDDEPTVEMLHVAGRIARVIDMKISRILGETPGLIEARRRMALARVTVETRDYRLTNRRPERRRIIA